MTMDVKEKHKTDRPGAHGSGSVWFGDERRRLPRVAVDEVAYVSSGGASTRGVAFETESGTEKS